MRVDVVGNGKKGTKSEIQMLREKVKPFTKKQIEELEQNTFNSTWTAEKEYNGMKFKVLSEHFDDDTREEFGDEYSVAWVDEEGYICSDRYFEIRLANGVIMTAEIEALNNYYIITNQI